MFKVFLFSCIAICCFMCSCMMCRYDYPRAAIYQVEENGLLFTVKKFRYHKGIRTAILIVKCQANNIADTLQVEIECRFTPSDDVLKISLDSSSITYMMETSNDKIMKLPRLLPKKNTLVLSAYNCIDSTASGANEIIKLKRINP